MTRQLTLGVDVGSSAVKLALVDYKETAEILTTVNERIRKRNPTQVIEQSIDRLLGEQGVRYEDLLYVASTGEGDLVPRKRGHFYSMTTHSRGGYHYHPEARTVVDMGALYCRVIALDGGARVRGYSMTGQCASGSGQFLENITRYLGVTLEQVGELSLQSTDPARTSGICAVLAETDVINMVSRGIATADIIKGIHLSIAGRIVQLLSRFKAEPPVVLTGGMSQNLGLVEVLREVCRERNLNLQIYPATNGVAAGAIGAAMWGGYRHFKLLGVSS